MLQVILLGLVSVALWIAFTILIAGITSQKWRWYDWLFAGRTLYGWYEQRHLREENAGRFLQGREKRQLLSAHHDGLLLDGAKSRLTGDASFRNLAVIATTGAGKTASFILPNLLTLDGASMVATDPS